jgi:hypothetical protein
LARCHYKNTLIVIVAEHTLVPWAVTEQEGLFNVLSFLGHCYLWLCMGKLQLTGQNPVWVFNFRSGRLPAALVWRYQVKLPNLKLKTRPKQLPGYLPIDILIMFFQSTFHMEI